MVNFGIVIFTSRYSQTLANTLQSLTNQTFRNFVVLLIDTSTTSNINPKLLPPGIDIQLVQDNLAAPFGQTLSQQIKQFSITHVLFLAEGDVLIPKTLEIVADSFSQKPEIEMLETGCLEFSSRFAQPTEPSSSIFKFSGKLSPLPTHDLQNSLGPSSTNSSGLLSICFLSRKRIEGFLEHDCALATLSSRDLKRSLFNNVQPAAWTLNSPLVIIETTKEAGNTTDIKTHTWNNAPIFLNIVEFAIWVGNELVFPSPSSISTSDSSLCSEHIKIDVDPELTGKVPITFTMTVYNEESRIKYALEHALRWADEIIVNIKASTDKTRQIVEKYGPRVKIVDLPFSTKGDDPSNIREWMKLPANDWVFIGTASEIPTRNLIKAIRVVLDGYENKFSLIRVPRKMYSMGVHSQFSPWYISNYPFLVNKKRALIGLQTHKEFDTRSPEEIFEIPYRDDCCVYHLTHPGAKSFITSMIDYYEAEARDCKTPDSRIEECFQEIARHQQKMLQGGFEVFGALCAWNIYWFSTALFLWEKQRGIDVPEYYKKLREDVFKKEWGNYP